jgi:hypothetical protein
MGVGSRNAPTLDTVHAICIGTGRPGILSKQAADQSVSQYLVTFQIKLRKAGQALPEPVLVELFISGLLPLIRVPCRSIK